LDEPASSCWICQINTFSVFTGKLLEPKFLRLLKKLQERQKSSMRSTRIYLLLQSQVKEQNRILQSFEGFSSEAPPMHGSDRLDYSPHPTKDTELMNHRHNNGTAIKPIDQFSAYS
jgi:hypothetical protein